MFPDVPALITDAVGRRGLSPRNDLAERGWRFWELRTLNRHRVVAFFDQHRPIADARALNEEIRGTVTRHFRSAWWRGMAYGVVADVASIAIATDDLKTLVDVRDNPRGTLQWVVLAAGDARTALSVHTWMETYLSPVYRDMVQALKGAGFQVATARREKDGLMKLLTAVADFDLALTTLGTRRKAFPEFRDTP
jgi:hypothetical protein